MHFMPSVSCSVKLCVRLMESRKSAQPDWANQPHPHLTGIKGFNKFV